MPASAILRDGQHKQGMSDTGCEHDSKLRENQAPDGLRSANVATARTEAPVDASTARLPSAPLDPGLATVIERWPTLSEAVRGRILEIIEASASG